MAEQEERVEETEVKDVGDKQVVRQSSSSSSTQETRLTLANGVWFVAGFIEILLAIRMILKLLGANPNSGFVDFIYAITGVFVTPFKGIFSTPVQEGDIVKSVFETGTLIAIIVYALVAWGIVKLINLNQPNQ